MIYLKRIMMKKNFKRLGDDVFERSE